jgi:hypothetical protein
MICAFSDDEASTTWKLCAFSSDFLPTEKTNEIFAI